MVHSLILYMCNYNYNYDYNCNNNNKYADLPALYLFEPIAFEMLGAMNPSASEQFRP